MTDNIKDKVVVITGASSGLGEAAERFWRKRARSWCWGRAASTGSRRWPLSFRLAKTRSFRPTSPMSARSGGLSTMRSKHMAASTSSFNNAGLMPHSPLERGKVDDWDRMIDVNIKGVLYGIAAALPHMKTQKSGHIINVSSVAGHKVGPGGAVYAATKHAVRVISEGLRQEVKPYNIRTTIISPGAVATELPASVTELDVAQGVRALYDRVAIPADSFARTVVFAMSQPDEVDINEILFRPTAQEY